MTILGWFLMKYLQRYTGPFPVFSWYIVLSPYKTNGGVENTWKSFFMLAQLKTVMLVR